MDYLPFYVAKVTETGLGESGREIKCVSDFMPSEAGQVPPLFDGLLKVPPPVVGEFVLIFQADSTNLNRWYHPIRTEFKTLTNTSDNIQIESEGDVDIEGASIKLGASASEAAVLGDQLKNWLNDLVSQIVSITVLGNLGAPTGPPINSVAIQTLAVQLANILSQKVSVE